MGRHKHKERGHHGHGHGARPEPVGMVRQRSLAATVLAWMILLFVTLAVLAVVWAVFFG